jgi:alpha-tubulin suppressor-like RCC1 family protein/uncharacterized Fe-S cluster-containing radical SAM superfamily protein
VTVRLNVLGSPVRSQRIELADPVAHDVQRLDLFITEACNLACTYCFESHKPRKTPEIEQCERAIDWLMRASSPKVHVTLWGGEPLLFKPALRHMVAYARAAASSAKKSVTFSMPTNGTLLDEETLRWIDEEKIALFLSIDGDAIGQSTRPTHGGASSYDMAMEGLRLAAAHLPKPPPVRMTVTPENVEHMARSAAHRGAHVCVRSRRFLPPPLLALLCGLASGCSLIVPVLTFGDAEPDAGPDANVDGGPDASADGGTVPDSGPCASCSMEAPFCNPDGQCVPCLENDDCDDASPCTVDRCTLTFECMHEVDSRCVVEIAAGQYNTCVVRGDGEVLCWGANESGQIGDGTSGGARSTPTVVDLATPIEHIAVGRTHVCATVDDGEVVCWGANGAGQLGDGTTDARSRPVPVMSLVGATAVACGDSFSCAVRSDVVCWGINVNGQLGTGSTSASPTLIPGPIVVGSSEFVEIALGGRHACARTTSGSVGCWGYNGSTQLGSSGAESATPVAVPGTARVTQIVSGQATSCALLDSGAVRCWGDNLFGTLGNGEAGNASGPVAVRDLTDAVELAAGWAHVCARRESGSVVCWGYNSDGQLGDGSTTDSRIPLRVDGLTDAVDLAVGRLHTCARRATGDVVCWGANGAGQLGDGTDISRPIPTPVLGL